MVRVWLRHMASGLGVLSYESMLWMVGGLVELLDQGIGGTGI